MEMQILFEEDQVLVIDKPAGVVVNRAESVKGETVTDWAEQQFKIQKSKFKIEETDFYSRSGIVHRLDKETSGCLIIAKNPESFIKLQAAFKERSVKKTYLALVHGELTGEGEIKAPVGRLPWNRERFGIVPGGKEASTKYKVIKVYSSSGAQQSREDLSFPRPACICLMQKHLAGRKRESIQMDPRSGSGMTMKSGYRLRSDNKYSLVELYPESGRTHQIRVHLKYINHPIVGDYLYAGRKVQKADRVWCPRVFLHAARIEFPHPQSGEMVKVESPLPEELRGVLNKLTIAS